eukprot:7791493-Pyramimonas_sp.AAC.1
MLQSLRGYASAKLVRNLPDASLPDSSWCRCPVRTQTGPVHLNLARGAKSRRNAAILVLFLQGVPNRQYSITW